MLAVFLLGFNSKVLGSRKGGFDLEQGRVFIVHLRRPSSAKDGRNDPFWEFGSFGLTGCHARNLLNPDKADLLKGAQFAFAQGGPLGTRLVYLTPPITITHHRNSGEDRNITEVKWTPTEMPFCYSKAPKLAYNGGPSDFPELEIMLQHVNRNTIEAQFSSRFRSRTTPLEGSLAEVLIRVYSETRKTSPYAIASIYSDALPWKLKVVDSDRQHTYEQLLIAARSEDATGKCRPVRSKKNNSGKSRCTSC
jgi:hypothetical protein